MSESIHGLLVALVLLLSFQTLYSRVDIGHSALEELPARAYQTVRRGASSTYPGFFLLPRVLVPGVTYHENLKDLGGPGGNLLWLWSERDVVLSRAPSPDQVHLGALKSTLAGLPIESFSANITRPRLSPPSLSCL